LVENIANTKECAKEHLKKKAKGGLYSKTGIL
jgi:hypothetical protein